MTLLAVAYDWSQWYGGWSVSDMLVIAAAGATPIGGLVLVRVAVRVAIALADAVLSPFR